MIGNVVATAVSGLAVARKRLETSARNIANMQTVGTPARPPSPTEELLGQQAYQPQRLVTFSAASGGVDSVRMPLTPATMRFPDPSNPLADADGFVEAPNVSLAREFVEARLAVHAYRANLKIIETVNEMMGELIDDKT